ncbi:MAG: histidine kinase [Erysipelotrichaceae bacterium]|nr:histidine kinase [Erysipelotrichaceae bacterium]
MRFEELLPILLPAGSLQIFVQGYYIWDCIHHPLLNKWAKLKYALGIAAFSLPVAAYYLLKERNEDIGEDISKGVFKSNVRQAIFVLIVIAFEILSITTVASYIGTAEFQPLVWISAISITVMIATELSIQRNKWTIAYTLSILLSFLGFALLYIVFDMNTPFLIIILSASIINNYPLKHVRKFIYFMIFGFVMMGIVRPMLVENVYDFDIIISSVYLNTVILVLVILSFYILKRQYITNYQLVRTLNVVESQNVMIEELSKTEERNKIAREIHDTVGHRLTGALYMIEAAKLNDDRSIINMKLDTAYNLIKDALSDIRHSVKLLVEDTSGVFSDKIETLRLELNKNTGLEIEIIVEATQQIPSIHQSLIFRALMECVTNTIKHSKSTKADILIQVAKSKLLFSYSDNGEGSKPFDMGFGLTSMKDSVESLGGLFSANNGNDGFIVNFTLPLGITNEGDLND